MKKLLLVIAGCFSVSVTIAQPWLLKADPTSQTLQNIAENFAANIDKFEENQLIANRVKEGKYYHFSRWMWYWERHLDTNGNMVSPLQTLREWRSWKEQYARSQHKGTANSSDWKFIGPDNSPGGGSGIGRLNVIEFHPKDTNTFWVGTGGGGAWKTTDHGISWTA